MEYVIGLLLGLFIGAAATCLGFDRDRAFYPTVLIVIAGYYVLFAVMAGSTPVLVVETLAAAVFTVAAILGFRFGLWLVAAGLVAHGIFDFGHHLLVANPAVPAWWPGFCLAIDVTLGLWLAIVLVRRPEPARRSVPADRGLSGDPPAERP